MLNNLKDSIARKKIIKSANKLQKKIATNDEKIEKALNKLDEMEQSANWKEVIINKEKK